jgi:Pyridoxal-dependent decarboxylase conserved domain
VLARLPVSGNPLLGTSWLTNRLPNSATGRPGQSCPSPAAGVTIRGSTPGTHTRPSVHAKDLVFEENDIGKSDSTAMVLAQYYNFVRYGRPGYAYIMENMQTNARVLAAKLVAMGRFEIIGPDEEQLPLVVFRLADDNGYNEFDIAWQLSAERGWMTPPDRLPQSKASS